MDPADDWGRIPSRLLDRGTFFSSPDPSEKGVQVDEEYDLENIWDSKEDTNIQEDSFVPGLVLEEIGPQVSLEENCNGNARQISRSLKEVRDNQFNLDQRFVLKVKFIDDVDCDQVKDEVRPSCAEKPTPPVLIVNSKKGRRYNKDFKKEVSEYFETHSVEETMQFFDISKPSVQRWTSVKDEGPVTSVQCGKEEGNSEEISRAESVPANVVDTLESGSADQSENVVPGLVLEEIGPRFGPVDPKVRREEFLELSQDLLSVHPDLNQFEGKKKKREVKQKNSSQKGGAPRKKRKGN